MLIPLTWGVLSGVGVVIVSRLPDVYRAESLILVDSQKIPERFVASTVQVTLAEHLAKVSQQILSTTQLEKLVNKFNLYPELRRTKSPEQVITQMHQDVEIIPEKGWGGVHPSTPTSTGAFKVAYEGPNPTVVAGVVNEIAGLFIVANLRARESRAEATSEFLESQLEEARKSLEKQEVNLSRFKTERIGELPQQEAALIGNLDRLHSGLQGNQDALNRAEQNKLMLENTLRLAETAEAAVLRQISISLKPTSNSTKTGSSTTTLVPPALRSQTLQEQLDALRLRYQDEHPEIKRLKAELIEATKQEAQAATVSSKAPAGKDADSLTAEVKTSFVPPELSAELNRERERMATTKTQLASMRKEMEARVADRQRILKSMAEYQAKVERLPIREQELAAVTRDYEMSKENYKSLLDKKMSAEMATDMERRQQAEQFTVQDPARIPSEPIKPKRLVLNVGVVIAGLVISMAVAFGLELRKKHFLGEWELPSSVPVLGRVPTIVIAMSSQSGSTK